MRKQSQGIIFFLVVFFMNIMSGCFSNSSIELHQIRQTEEITEANDASATLQHSSTASALYIPILPSATATPSLENRWNESTGWTSANQIWDIQFDPSETLWTSGPGGVVQWNFDRLESTVAYHYGIGPNETDAIAMVVAADGSIWVTRWGKGLYRFFGNNWVNYSAPEDIPSGQITNMTSTGDNSIWITTKARASDENPKTHGHFGKFDGAEWTEASDGELYRITASPDGSIWAIPDGPEPYVITFNDPIHYIHGEWERIIQDTDYVFTALDVSANGDVWAAGDDVVFHISGSTISIVTPPWKGSVGNNSVVVIEANPDGRIWSGFSYNVARSGSRCSSRDGFDDKLGVYVYDGKKWTHYTTADGLADENVCAIKTGPDGSIWVGTYDRGLSHFNGNHWTSYAISTSDP